jgi:hypothetical protein
MLNDPAARTNFRSLTSSNAYERKQFTEHFIEKVKFAETSLLPSLATALDSAEAKVKKYALAER